MVRTIALGKTRISAICCANFLLPFSFCLQFSTDLCLFWLLDPVSLIKLPEDEGEVCLMKNKKTKSMELSHEFTSRCVQYFGTGSPLHIPVHVYS